MTIVSVLVFLTLAGETLSNVGLEKEPEHKDYESPVHSLYDRKVQDGHTGDVKSHQESREGGTVKGVYMQHQPDGTILAVHYTVDKYNGYNVVIKKLGLPIHPAHRN